MWYIIIQLHHTYLMVESINSSDSSVVLNRLKAVRKNIPSAVLVTKALYDELVKKPLSIKERIRIYHSLHNDCMAFCNNQAENISRGKILFVRLQRRLSKMMAKGQPLSLAYNDIRHTLGAE